MQRSSSALAVHLYSLWLHAIAIYRDTLNNVWLTMSIRLSAICCALQSKQHVQECTDCNVFVVDRFAKPKNSLFEDVIFSSQGSIHKIEMRPVNRAHSCHNAAV